MKSNQKRAYFSSVSSLFPLLAMIYAIASIFFLDRYFVVMPQFLQTDRKMSFLFFIWLPLFFTLIRLFLKKSGLVSAQKAEAALYLFLAVHFISVFFAAKNNIISFAALTASFYEMVLFIGLQALLFCFFFLMLNLLFVFYKVVKNKA